MLRITALGFSDSVGLQVKGATSEQSAENTRITHPGSSLRCATERFDALPNAIIISANPRGGVAPYFHPLRGRCPRGVIIDRGSELCRPPTSASPRKLTSGPDEKLEAMGHLRTLSSPRALCRCVDQQSLHSVNGSH